MRAERGEAMKDILGKTMHGLLAGLWFMQGSFGMQDDDLGVDRFLVRVRPLSERHDRTNDNRVLQIKRDVKAYIKNNYTDHILEDIHGHSKKEYIQREGLFKVFPAFLEEPTSLKILQLRDLYRLGEWHEEERTCNDIFQVLFNLENHAHPFADFPQDHPFRQHHDLWQFLHTTLQELQGPASAA